MVGGSPEREGAIGNIITETGRFEMSRYTVYIEQTTTGFSGHVPDLPGCVAAAATLDETRKLMREAIEFHVEGMRINGEAIPAPEPGRAPVAASPRHYARRAADPAAQQSIAPAVRSTAACDPLPLRLRLPLERTPET